MATEEARERFMGALNMYFKTCTTREEVVKSFDEALNALKFHYSERYVQIAKEEEARENKNED